MSKIIFTIGIQASGKSTWAKEFCHNNPTYIRINRDDLRKMRGDYWIPVQEYLITEFENSCIDSALKNNFNVIVDATNLNETFLNKSIKRIQAKFPDTKFEFKIFDISLEEAIERDKKRIDPVGEEVIRKAFSRYTASKNSGKLIPEIESVIVEKIIQNPDLPHIIICDIDGTVALNNGRCFFDCDKVDNDLPNEPVVNLIRDLIQTCNTVIFLSGRDEICRQKTSYWLQDHGLATYNDYIDNHKYSLFMRKHNDFRPDEIIKKELFNTYIKDKYFVDCIFDDRLKVCRMWYKLGLPLFKVGDPDLDF